jgi:cell wall-associated NlpC family hydrolase
VAERRAGGTAGLLLVALVLFLAAPHTAPTLERVGLGEVLRQAVGGRPHLPRLPVPELGQPGRGGAPSPTARKVVAFALAQRGKPYRWGQEGPGGFDCSGLSWAAYRAAGLAWPRLTADGQWRRGPRVHGQSRTGDLVFFHTPRMPAGHAGHVGVYLGEGRMVEAPRPGALVRVASTHRGGYLGATRPGGGGR